MNKVKYIQNNASNPDQNGMKKDPHLNLTVGTVTHNGHELYELIAERSFGHITSKIKNLDSIRVNIRYLLGYIPSDIEEVNGDINMSSAAVIGKYIELFDKGKIFESNFAPFKCCRVHNKKIDYWDVPRDEKIRRFVLLADELFYLN
jgi:hypothetical protein